MQNKQHAHELVERLEDAQILTAVRFLEFMILDPVSRSLATAPEDEESLTEDEEKALADAKEWFRLNKGITHEEVLAEFGLQSENRHPD